MKNEVKNIQTAGYNGTRTGKKSFRSTNPETPKDRLFISNCFELPSVAQQPIRGQLKTITGLWGARICTS
jgi:hypothetical protein